MPRRGLLGACLAALATLSLIALLHAQAPAGTITGHVRLTAPVRVPLPANAYPSRSVGRHEAPGTAEIKNVVVYLKDAPFHGTLPVTHAELRQENETFVPHVLAVTRG